MRITIKPKEIAIENVLKWGFKSSTNVLYVLSRSGKKYVEEWYDMHGMTHINSMKDDVVIWTGGVVEKTLSRDVEPGPLGGFCPV